MTTFNEEENTGLSELNCLCEPASRRTIRHSMQRRLRAPAKMRTDGWGMLVREKESCVEKTRYARRQTAVVHSLSSLQTNITFSPAWRPGISSPCLHHQTRQSKRSHSMLFPTHFSIPKMLRPSKQADFSISRGLGTYFESKQFKFKVMENATSTQWAPTFKKGMNNDTSN